MGAGIPIAPDDAAIGARVCQGSVGILSPIQEPCAAGSRGGGRTRPCTPVRAPAADTLQSGGWPPKGRGMRLCTEGRGDVPVGGSALRREVSGPSMVSSRPVSHMPLAGEPRAPRPHVRAPPAFTSARHPPSGSRSRGSARAARCRKNACPPPPPAYGSNGSVRNERGSANARAIPRHGAGRVFLHRARASSRRRRERPGVAVRRKRRS